MVINPKLGINQNINVISQIDARDERVPENVGVALATGSIQDIVPVFKATALHVVDAGLLGHVVHVIAVPLLLPKLLVALDVILLVESWNKQNIVIVKKITVLVDKLEQGNKKGVEDHGEGGWGQVFLQG